MGGQCNDCGNHPCVCDATPVDHYNGKEWVNNPIGDSFDEMTKAVQLANGDKEMKTQLNRLWIIIEAVETDHTVQADTITRLTAELAATDGMCDKYLDELTASRADAERLREALLYIEDVGVGSLTLLEGSTMYDKMYIAIDKAKAALAASKGESNE